MALITQENKTSNTFTQENVTAQVTITQENKTRSSGYGKVFYAFLHPFFLKSGTNNLFVQETRS